MSKLSRRDFFKHIGLAIGSSVVPKSLLGRVASESYTVSLKSVLPKPKLDDILCTGTFTTFDITADEVSWYTEE